MSVSLTFSVTFSVWDLCCCLLLIWDLFCSSSSTHSSDRPQNPNKPETYKPETVSSTINPYKQYARTRNCSWNKDFWPKQPPKWPLESQFLTNNVESALIWLIWIYNSLNLKDPTNMISCSSSSSVGKESHIYPPCQIVTRYFSTFPSRRNK